MRSGVDVYANAVYTVLNNAAEGVGKSVLLHIVLILTYTDSLGLDFYKLCKGILKSTRDGNSGTLHNVELGELVSSKLGCGVYGSARLGNDGVLYTLGTEGIAKNSLSNESLGLT